MWIYGAILTMIANCGYTHDHSGFIEETPNQKETMETKTLPQVVLVYYGSVCTGVIVAHNYVLTAAHCKAGSQSIAVYHHDGPKLGETTQRLAPTGNDPDIALLKFPDGTFTEVPLKLGFDVSKNDAVDVIGFGCNDVISKIGQTIKRHGTNHVLNVFEFITLYTSLRLNGKLIVGSNNVAGICDGDSGSPLLKNDKVVGIASISEIRSDRVYSWFVNLSNAPARAFLSQYLTLQ